MNETCMFCKIINGSESAQVLYRDENVITFFPKTMNVKGHMIIAPIMHFTDIFDIQEDVLNSLMDRIIFLSNHCQQKLEAEGVNILHASGERAQQSIPHFHFHLLPRFKNDNIDAWPNLPVWDGDSEALLDIMKVIGKST